jgi:hypothetical protein
MRTQWSDLPIPFTIYIVGGIFGFSHNLDFTLLLGYLQLQSIGAILFHNDAQIHGLH